MLPREVTVVSDYLFSTESEERTMTLFCGCPPSYDVLIAAAATRTLKRSLHLGRKMFDDSTPLTAGLRICLVTSLERDL